MEVLSQNQKKILYTFGQSSISKIFYLTGGTALSAFYLQHRYSEDFDFFTNEKNSIASLRSIIIDVLTSASKEVKIIRSFETFLESHLVMHDGEIIKIDFAFDSPFRLQPTIFNNEFGIYVDNILDIGCNKISALFDRADVKDFVDLYFLLKEKFMFSELWNKANQKHDGLDEYWFCQALTRILDISQLPKMIKPVTIEELRQFFIELHDSIIRK